MKMNYKRFLAVLMALMMSLGILPALAEAPAAGAMPNPWALDKTVEMDLSIEVNPMLGGLLSSLSGAQQSEEDQAKLFTVVSAFNKLKASMLIDKKARQAPSAQTRVSCSISRPPMTWTPRRTALSAACCPGSA